MPVEEMLAFDIQGSLEAWVTPSDLHPITSLLWYFGEVLMRCRSL